jgi:transposase
MYLRSTARRNADGSTVKYLQLAESVWDSNKRCAVARVVYNFGRSDSLDQEALRRLAQSILRIFPAEETIAADPQVKVFDSWPYGGAHVLDSLWHELGIDQVIEAERKAHRVNQPFERALFAMVANRALRPYSKLNCQEQWLPEEVFFQGRESLDLHHLYGAMDFLEKHKEEVEKQIYFRTADLLNADVDLVFYDTTSLHFEIDEDDEEPAQGSKAAGEKEYPALRKRGKSKNGRTDVPQVVVGLAVTRDGLPVRSWVFPGSTNDMSTVEKVKADLRGWRLGRCVFVADAGMNSAENRHTLALGGGKYILAARMRAGDEVTKEVITRPGRYQEVKANLRVKEVVVGDGERRRRYVVCHNPQEAERQKRHREEVLKELRAELKSLKDPKKGARHSKRTCELLTTERYSRYLRQTKRGKLRIDHAGIAAEAKLDGKWVVTSNDDTLTAEDLALGYKQLMRVEMCWRTMKSGLRTRPVFHWKPHRICAHVSLCVLALLLERIAEIRCGDTWRNAVAVLDTVKVVEYERNGARILQTTELRGEVRKLLAKLKIDTPPMIHRVAPGFSKSQNA